MQKLSILGAVFVLFLVLESVWPLRPTFESKLLRLARNSFMAVLSGVVARFTAVVIVLWAAEKVATNQLGLLPTLGAESWSPMLRTAIELLVLDYLIYHWHRLNHVVPLLWRFHQPHHLDHELDASTALRFHFFEIVLSGFFRGASILALGFSLESVVIFEVLVTAAAIFHHSNFKMPLKIETLIGKLIITPRRHWVHHRAIRKLTDSCYGTVLSVWDRLHGTLMPLEENPQTIIGVSSDDSDVPSARKPDGMFDSLLAPFTRNP